MSSGNASQGISPRWSIGEELQHRSSKQYVVVLEQPLPGCPLEKRVYYVESEDGSCFYAKPSELRQAE